MVQLIFFYFLYYYNTPFLQKLMHTRTKEQYGIYTNVVADSCNLKTLQKQSHIIITV